MCFLRAQKLQAASTNARRSPGTMKLPSTFQRRGFGRLPVMLILGRSRGAGCRSVFPGIQHCCEMTLRWRNGARHPWAAGWSRKHGSSATASTSGPSASSTSCRARTPPTRRPNSATSESVRPMRKPMLSRYYIQCDLEARLEDWPDERFWQEFRARCSKDVADSIVTGPSIEKSIAPLRSFVAEPMRYGHLFLGGDAAHIVPPTGAKGLNLAVSDVFYLSRALTETYRTGRTHYLDCYSDMALRRVWGGARMSWWLTMLLHRFPAETAFEEQMRLNQFDYLHASEHAQASLAEQYVGLPFEA